MKSLSLFGLAWAAGFLAPGALRAEVRFSRPFSSHMVLQRELAVPVWGMAEPGEVVTVEFRGQRQSATADAEGRWRVQLPPMKAGGPDTLTAGGQKLEDVLVGEVWVGSGQSNMAIPVKNFARGDAVLEANAKGSYLQLRLLKQGKGDAWQVATPEVNEEFSALLFSFGLPLQKELGVPVGLMVGAVGGTPSGYWLSDEMYRGDAASAAAVKKYATTFDRDAQTARYTAEKAKYDEAMEAWKPLAAAAKAEGKPAPAAPRAPQRVVEPGESSGRIGSLFESFIRPMVGYGIRGVLWDQGEARTHIAGVDQPTLMSALIRGWREAWGEGDFPFLYVEKPSGGGPAWDYSNPVTAKAEPFAPLPAAVPAPPGPEYTQAEYVTLMRNPNTWMVTASDLGGSTHPVNKSGYGLRAEQVALVAAYGRRAEVYGPLYASQTAEPGRVTLHFTHIGQGLAYKNGDRLQGFAIAGEDRKFVWAEAAIAGETVVVSSPAVPKPVAVRYAWSGRFPWANLFNKDGLPAQPFRTDEW